MAIFFLCPYVAYGNLPWQFKNNYSCWVLSLLSVYKWVWSFFSAMFDYQRVLQVMLPTRPSQNPSIKPHRFYRVQRHSVEMSNVKLEIKKMNNISNWW